MVARELQLERYRRYPRAIWSLTDHQHQMIDTLVRSGRYQNASEVLREGLRLIEQCEAEAAIKLEALRRAAQVGWDYLAVDRYRDVSNDSLEDFTGQLGNRAGERGAPGADEGKGLMLGPFLPAS